MAGLLDPLTSDQQRIIDLVAEALALDNEWPLFDYLEGTFDRESADAGETLASFPRIGSWAYGAVWWVGVNNLLKPTPETEVGLTLVGMHHSKVLRPLVDAFFDVIGLMVSRRQMTALERRKPRELLITDRDVGQLFKGQRVLAQEHWPRWIFKLLEREPTFGGSSTFGTDGHWTRHVPREIKEFEGVTTIEGYVERIERITAFPPQAVALATPSPLDLVAALDYLDAVWRAAHMPHHLFTYPSAEKVAKLAHDANTPEEFDSRLSALGEILRSANRTAKTVSGAKLAAQTFNDPLMPLEDHLVRTVDPSAEARIRQAVTDLEHALALRDAAQHVEAGHRAVAALEAFGIGHPMGNVNQAWLTVSSHVIEALGAIREEISSL